MTHHRWRYALSPGGWRVIMVGAALLCAVVGIALVVTDKTL